MSKHFFLFLLSFLIGQIVLAQSTEVLTIRKYDHENAFNILSEFTAFLSQPNVAKDSVTILKNTSFVMEMMNKRGIQKVQLLHASTTGAPPAVYGEVMVPGAKLTLIFYAHYDGQPVNASQWAKGLGPFQPKLYTASIEKNGINIPLPTDGKYNNEWRIYARSAADDKGGVEAIIDAYDAIKNSRLHPTCNLKFFFEGEEETGSAHLNEILEKYSSLLQSDLWIICDSPIHQSGKKQIVYGVRGMTHLDLTIYGPKRPLHSGIYGNWAPNPALMLAKLLSSMKDENGRVTVKGFYDDVTPLGPSERKALEEAPSADELIKNEFGINEVEMQGKTLGEAINLPSLNINGILSGNVGKQATNQIPAFATAVIDLRLVIGNDWERQLQKVTDHIKAQGYYVTDREPTDEERTKYPKIIKVIPGDGYNAQRTSMDLPIIKKVIAAVRTTTNDQVVLQPTMGGSLPLFLFEKYLNGKTIIVPIANYDNNQHSEDENIRLGNLFDGIETMASLMMIK
jgi:acetylornithine deacetylase/succinyl-diaminopimelate desuccinylase-like protein